MNTIFVMQHIILILIGILDILVCCFFFYSMYKISINIVGIDILMIGFTISLLLNSLIITSNNIMNLNDKILTCEFQMVMFAYTNIIQGLIVMCIGYYIIKSLFSLKLETCSIITLKEAIIANIMIYTIALVWILILLVIGQTPLELDNGLICGINFLNFNDVITVAICGIGSGVQICASINSYQFTKIYYLFRPEYIIDSISDGSKISNGSKISDKLLDISNKTLNTPIKIELTSSQNNRLYKMSRKLLLYCLPNVIQCLTTIFVYLFRDYNNITVVYTVILLLQAFINPIIYIYVNRLYLYNINQVRPHIDISNVQDVEEHKSFTLPESGLLTKYNPNIRRWYIVTDGPYESGAFCVQRLLYYPKGQELALRCSKAHMLFIDENIRFPSQVQQFKKLVRDGKDSQSRSKANQILDDFIYEKKNITLEIGGVGGDDEHIETVVNITGELRDRTIAKFTDKTPIGNEFDEALIEIYKLLNNKNASIQGFLGVFIKSHFFNIFSNFIEAEIKRLHSSSDDLMYDVLSTLRLT